MKAEGPQEKTLGSKQRRLVRRVKSLTAPSAAFARNKGSIRKRLQ
jgi:hypothetical protein